MAALGKAAAAEQFLGVFLESCTVIGVPAGCTISGYFALDDELDPALLLDALRATGREIVFPVVVGPNMPLIFRLCAPGDPLENGAFGTCQPAKSLPEKDPEVVLVPLLAFDRSGNRLGYGGGYYDKTLARLRSRCAIIAVGVALSVQEVDMVPNTDQDQQLDWIVTEECIIKAL
jgi:5-formyltetrahydrofolate cyclo-ligase